MRRMAKARTQFVCRECGGVQARWMGKCPDCGAWDALEEFRPADASAKRDPFGGPAGGAGTGAAAAPQALPIGQAGAEPGVLARLGSGISELDRVLGGGSGEVGELAEGGGGGEGGERSRASLRLAAGVGADHVGGMGLVPGSAVLLGGDPGIGKSTLMLQMAAKLAAAGRRVLYVTSEESAGQLRLRAQRLLNGQAQKLPEQLYVLADTNLARIVEQARKLEPAVVIVDSIQMIYKGDLPAAPGSVTQLRACCLELVYFAKQTGSALMLIGHVTKQGALAGPRLLEHMVDTVLYFEGDRYHSHRVVRGIKNRFGTTLEVGLFEMTDGGLAEVPDGSGLLAKEYQSRSGSVVCPVLQGTRCLLVEVQALTATGFLGSVKRKVSGLDGSRLAMLIAVLEKRGGLRLADQDVFASAVGGMKVTEPAADLATALAIAGAHYDRQVGSGVCAVGEIGLGGELRHVQQMERRLREASRLGFGHVLCPPTNVKPPKGCTLVPVRTLSAALEQLA